MRRTVKEEAAVEYAGSDAHDGAPEDAREQAVGDAGEAREREAGAQEEAHEDDTAAAIESQSRRLRNSIISLAVFFVLLVGLLTGVPGLRSAAERITDAKPAWVVAGVIFGCSRAWATWCCSTLCLAGSDDGSSRACRSRSWR
jgi:hypothetical protein